MRFEDGRFTTFTTRDGMPADPVSQIVEDRQGNLWLGTRGGLVRFTDGRFTTVTTRDGLPDNLVHAIFEGRDGSVWVGTGAGGVARFRSGHVTTFTTADGLPSNTVRALLEDRAGGLWAGTDRGVARLEPATAHDQTTNSVPRPRRFIAYTTRDGLSDTVVRSLLEDREGNVWVGTNTGGLNRLKRKQVTAFGRPDGLPGDGVVPITEDADGTLWIGMTCGGLVRYRDGTFTTYGLRDGLPNDCIWSLLSDAAGGLWIGTWGGGLTRRDRDGRFTTYTPQNSGLPGSAVLALFQDRAGVVWVGTGSGLARLVDGVFTVYRRQDGLVHDEVRFITDDREGGLWIGTIGGASRFKDGQFTNYTRTQGLSSDFVRAIHQTDDGTLWLGTYGGGLNRMRDGRITHYTTRQGMFENIVSRILEDDQGQFWMTGNKGIVRVTRAELEDLAAGKINSITSVVYGVGDGMRSAECNGGGQPAGWKGRDGRLWFPTARGVAAIDPRRIQSSEVVPPVVIEQVLVNRNAQDPRGDIEVPAGAGALEIHYTGLSFSAPEYVRFRYRLSDLEEDWTDAGTRRTAYYSYLPPGRHTFSVIAADRNGVWNTEGAATMAIEVLPPFYRTWWFTTAGVAILGAVLLVAHERRIRRFTRAQAAQEAFSRQLIESQESERKRIAAELHDSLSQTMVVIKNRALISLQTPEDHEAVREQIGEIADAATHAIDEVREIAYNLRPHHLDRLGLTKAIDAMIEKIAAVNGIRFTKDLDALDGVFPSETEINVYRIVQEGVTNIVKHADASEASLTIKRTPRGVAITLRDNGRGFVRDDRQATSGRGFGLVGIAERARLLGGEPVIESAPGQGTTIRITLAASR